MLVLTFYFTNFKLGMMKGNKGLYSYANRKSKLKYLANLQICLQGDFFIGKKIII